MAIHMRVGVLGSGKGMDSMGLIIRELRDSQRVIMTNFAVELMPWQNGVGKTQSGLVGYCRYVLKDEKMVEAAQERVFRVPDDIMHEFFLYRAVRNGEEKGIGESICFMKGIKYSIWKCPATYKTAKDGEAKLVKFDNCLLGKGPMYYDVDEAWKFWPARDWDTTAKAFLYYAAHSRKTGDEVYLTSHSTKDIDSAVIRKIQDFRLCVNRGKRLVFGFRQPSDIKVRVCSHVPTGAKADNVMQTVTIPYKDFKGIGQCYDTTGGVGLTGRMVGDLNEKKRGLPFWMLQVGIPAVVAVLIWGLWFILRANEKRGHERQAVIMAEARAKADNHNVVQTNAPTFATSIAQGFANYGNDAVAPMKAKMMQDLGIDPKPVVDDSKEMVRTQEVYCTGFCVLAGSPVAYLSDGSSFEDREIQRVTKAQIFLRDGRIFKVKSFSEKPVVQRPPQDSRYDLIKQSLAGLQYNTY